MSLWAIRFLGEADGTFWFTAALSVSVLINAVVSPILGAMSDRVGRRKPFLAFFTVAVHRRDGRHRLRRHPARPGCLRDRQLRLPGGAHLLRRPAARRRAADRARTAVGHRRRRSATCGTLLVGGLLLAGRHHRRRRRVDAATLRARRGAVRRLRRPAVPARHASASGRDAVQRGRCRPLAGRSWATTIRHARESPGLLRFIVARFFYSDPVNTGDRGDERVRGLRRRLHRGRGAPGAPAPDRRGGLASFGWGYLADRWGPRRTLFAVLATWAAGLTSSPSSCRPCRS